MDILGDFNKSYRISLDFIRQEDTTPLLYTNIVFELPEKNYQAYSKNLGKNSNFCILTTIIELTNFITNQKAFYLYQFLKVTNKNHQHKDKEVCPECVIDKDNIFIFHSGDEFIIDKFTIKISAYTEKNNFFAYFKIINRSPEELKISADKIKLSCGGQIYSSSKEFSEEKKKLGDINKDFGPQTVIMVQNDRLDFTIKFSMKEPGSQYILQLDGIANHKDQRLFYEDLNFTSAN